MSCDTLIEDQVRGKFSWGNGDAEVDLAKKNSLLRHNGPPPVGLSIHSQDVGKTGLAPSTRGQSTDEGMEGIF